MSSATQQDTSEVWQRLNLVDRQMAIAAADEDYAMAARLRDESKLLVTQLSPVQKFSYSQVAVLKANTATVEEKLVALQALATTGEAGVLGGVSSCLGQPALQEGAEEAMWAVFMHSPDPAVNELMREGMRHMSTRSTLPKALEVFERMVRLAPSFAEGYNKRATVLYSMEQYAASAEDCKVVLEMQPYHYAAASGMGMCYMQLAEYANAIAAFNTALAINPAHAPISKALFITSVGTSVLLQAFKGPHHTTSRVLQLATTGLAFRGPGELLIGAILLYYLRLVERQTGSAKFATFAALSALSSTATHVALSHTSWGHKLVPGGGASGPYAFIFACMVHFFCSVPPSVKFNVAGLPLSDKVFLYVAGIQLMLSGGASSLCMSMSGIASGLAYHLNVAGVKNWRFPAPLRRLATSFLAPWLQGRDSSQRQAQQQQQQTTTARGAPDPAGSASAGTADAGGSTQAVGSHSVRVDEGGGGDSSTTDVSEEALETLTAMGFGRLQAERALQLTHNDVNGALGLLL
ncbi:MAG: hypothetical protein WDW38_000541 [Sanguina aurantia]